MAQVNSPAELQNIAVADLPRRLTIFISNLLNQVNGGLNFKYNIASSSALTFNFTKANTDTTVQHDLGSIPTGYLIKSCSAPMSVFNGVKSWTDNNITLQSNATGTVVLYAI